MILEHQGRRPRLHPSAYVAPTAVVCGDVVVGENTRILFGAVITAENGSIEIGSQCVIIENAVVRASSRHPVRIGNHVLVGPHAHLTGCTVEDDVFIATGASIFNLARLGARSEVRINGIVHVRSVLPPDATVPIGWVAVGDPVQMFPTAEHEKIWQVLKPLHFPRTVFGLERPAPGETLMPELTRRYARALALHKEDRLLDG